MKNNTMFYHAAYPDTASLKHLSVFTKALKSDFKTIELASKKTPKHFRKSPFTTDIVGWPPMFMDRLGICKELPNFDAFVDLKNSFYN